MSTISELELQEIVEVVWMTVLELPVTPDAEKDVMDGQILTSIVQISGAWHGKVMVRASVEFLEQAAALMFSIDRGDVKHIDCVDTLSELTNMLGGTVKCLLPETCDLSLPAVEADNSMEAESRQWVNFKCKDNPFAVAVIESADGAKHAA
jgi:CheY-specific phosphatase CheX